MESVGMRSLCVIGLGVLVGCDPVVGEACGDLRISEVRSSGEFGFLEEVQMNVDYVELWNGTGAWASLDGIGVDGPGDAVVEHPFDPDMGLEDGAYEAFVASSYDGEPEFFSLLFDLNNTTSGVALMTWAGDHWLECQAVSLGQQHAELSLSAQPDGTWCATVPTPGEPNEPCLCDDSSKC